MRRYVSFYNGEFDNEKVCDSTINEIMNIFEMNLTPFVG